LTKNTTRHRRCKVISDKIEISVKELLYMWYAVPVSIIKKLYPIMEKERILKLVKDAVWETTLKMTGGPQLKSFEDFLKRGASELIKKTTEREAGEVKRNEVSFKITKCLWAEIFKSMKASEIGEVLVCESDFPRAKAWSPKLELKRTQTIMEGAPYCDFCYIWKE